MALLILFGTMGLSWLYGSTIWPQHIEDKSTFVTLWSIGLNIGCELFAVLLYLPGYMGWSKYYADHLVNKKASRPW